MAELISSSVCVSLHHFAICILSEVSFDAEGGNCADFDGDVLLDHLVNELVVVVDEGLVLAEVEGLQLLPGHVRHVYYLHD